MKSEYFKQTDNVLSFRKTDRFGLFLADVTVGGEVVERERVGSAYLKPGAKLFRLKIWVQANNQYFLVQDKSDSTKYIVLALDEYQTPQGEVRTNWNRVGQGQLIGNFVKLSLHLASEDLFLCLFPEVPEAQEAEVAS